MKYFLTLPLMLAVTSTAALNVNEKQDEEPSLSSISFARSSLSSKRSPASYGRGPVPSTKRPERRSLFLDKRNIPPVDAPCQDDTKVATAMECVADYTRDGKCSWENWTEMYINCDLPGAQIDDYLLPLVKANECTWDRWTDGVYLPLFDDYLKDCSGDGGGNNNGGPTPPPGPTPAPVECIDTRASGSGPAGDDTRGTYIDGTSSQCEYYRDKNECHLFGKGGCEKTCGICSPTGPTPAPVDSPTDVIIVKPALNPCEILRLELIIGCTALLSASFFGAIAYAGCMATSATAWHICFENLDRRLSYADDDIRSSNHLCGDVCMEMLHSVDAPEANEYDISSSISGEEAKKSFDEGMAFGHDLVAKLGEQEYLLSVDLSMFN